MIDPTPQPLPQRWPAEGRTGTTIPGWKGLLVAVPFLATGVLIAALAARRHRPGGAPPGVLAAFGALYVAAAVLVLERSVRSILRERRGARLRARADVEPWRTDFPWDRRGCVGDSGRAFRAALFALAGMAAFGAPFAYLAFGWLDPARNGRGAWVFRGSVVLFGVMATAIAASVAYLLARRLKYGAGFLRFGRFPFLIGETADLRLDPPRRARGLRRVEVTLRCVEERIQQEREGGVELRSVARWQLWADRRTMDADLGGTGLELSFALPSDPALATTLSAESPRYWELVAKAGAPGVDYTSSFLVPIYAPPVR